MNKKDLVKKYIIDLIENGKWSQGKKIFSENQFIEYLHVSRGTVRGAILELTQEGVLESIQGSGSYVKENSTIKNNILILTQQTHLNGEITNSFSYVFDKLKENINIAGYNPIAFVNNKVLPIEETIKPNINNIAGVISLFGNHKDEGFISEKYIPCVSTLRVTASEYPSVLLDYRHFFFKINDLINKYNFNKVIFFSRKANLSNKKIQNGDGFYFYAMEKYFGKYEIYSIPYNRDNNSINIKHLRLAFDNIKTSPNLIVFLDDTLYNKMRPYFPNYEHILSKTKIITHASHKNIIDNEYNVCRITFDLDKLAEKTVELLVKMIKKEHIEKYNIPINVIVENEKALQ